MVSYKVPTVNFGSPPDPSKPQLHYPGVSSNKFDPLEALIVYRERLVKERSLTSDQKQNIEARKGPVPHAGIMHDMMPGYGSVAETYAHMGFTVNPLTNQLVPPDIQHAPTHKRPRSKPPSAGSQSRRDLASQKLSCARPASAVPQSRQNIHISRPSSRPASAGFQNRRDESACHTRPSSRPGSAPSRRDSTQQPICKRPPAAGLDRVQSDLRPASAGSRSRQDNKQEPVSRRPSSGSGAAATVRSSSVPTIKNPHWDMPRLPEFRPYFETPTEGVCCLSQKELATMAKEKALLQETCGQNRVLCFC